MSLYCGRDHAHHSPHPHTHNTVLCFGFGLFVFLLAVIIRNTWCHKKPQYNFPPPKTSTSTTAVHLPGHLPATPRSVGDFGIGVGGAGGMAMGGLSGVESDRLVSYQHQRPQLPLGGTERVPLYVH